MTPSGAPSGAPAAERGPGPDDTPVRLANFMDSALVDLEAKGNLDAAPALYNPDRVAEKVVHFTPSREDVRLAPLFEPWRIEIFPYLEPPGSGARVVRAVRALRRVRSKIRDERLNLVRGRLPYFGSLAGTLAARRLGIASVVSLGGDNRLAQERTGKYHFGSRPLSYAVESLVLRLANRVIAPNRFTRDYVARLIGRRSAERKTIVIPWVVELPGETDPTGSILEELHLDPARPLVLIVGFLNHYKYTETMYEVALRVSEHATVQFAFCGDGPLRSRGERLFASHQHVRLLGWLPRHEVLALLDVASVVLVPMSGFVLLEAAARARAVVAGRVEWHGELVEDGVSGYLLDPTDSLGWADKTLSLLQNASLRNRLGGNLAARFRAGFDPDRTRALEVALYRELASSARSRTDGPGSRPRTDAGP